MQAIVIMSSADGGTLECRDVPEPTPRPGELLVRVRATGLNRADLAQRRGAYPRPATGGDSDLNIAGLEATGEVAGLGEGVTGFTIRDRVMAMCAGGAGSTGLHGYQWTNWQDCAYGVGAIPVAADSSPFPPVPKQTG
jgi:NADPH:quinone reductase-like Zn-dependent oxidoreductase